MPVETFAKTIYVRKTGSDANNGSTPALAKLTIGSALSTQTIAGWNKIVIGPGSYSELINYVSTTNFIVLHGDIDGTLTGDTPGQVIITGSANSPITCQSMGEMWNIKVTNSGTGTSTTAFLSNVGSISQVNFSFYANNCTFDGLTSSNMSIGYARAEQAWTYDNCNFVYTPTTAKYLAYISGYWGCTVNIINSTIIGATGLHFTSSSGSSIANYHRFFFTNSTLKMSNAIANANAFYIDNCTIQVNATNLFYMTVADRLCYGDSYIKNSVVQNWSSVNLNLDAICYFASIPAPSTHITAQDLFTIYQLGGLHIENVNDIEEQRCQLIGAPYVVATTDTYNSKPVLKIKTNTAATAFVLPFKIPVANGQSTTVTIPFKYSTTSAVAPVLKLCNKTDVMRTPEQTISGLTMASLINWTEKTFTFTPTSDGFYYIVFDTSITNVNNFLEIGELVIS